MTRAPALLLPALALALWPVPGRTQEGPSFDCDDARTATEFAICASPELSRLEMRMYHSYLGLVDAIGERQARRIADRFLERRQACGSDEDCIAQRLVISMDAFERRAGQDTQLAARERGGEDRPPPAEDLAAAEPVPAPAPEAATAAPEPTSRPDIPLAAQAPPPDLAPAPEDSATDLAAAPPPSPGALGEAIGTAELASSDRAPADTPMSLAFMDLPRENRAAIQARLQATGYYEGPAEGTWDRATMEALDAWIAAEGEGFAPSTRSGATLALDFLGSDAFAQAHGLPIGEAPPDAAADPLSSSDW